MPAAGTLVGAVQFIGEGRQRRPRYRRQPQRAANDRARGFPFSAIEQAGAWISVPPARCNEHVAPAQRNTQFGQNTEGVSVQINGIVLAQYVAFPRLGDDVARRIVPWPLHCHVGAKPGKGGDERLASGVRAKVNVLDQRRQEAAHGLILGVQFLVVHIVGRSNQFVDASEGQCKHVR